MRTAEKPTNMSDSDVIRLYLKTQQPNLFDILYRRYAGKVYSKCISILKDDALAQDAMQDIFTKIFLNLSKFGEKSQFSTWVYSIAYNYCIDFLRRKKKERDLFTDESHIQNAGEPVEEDNNESILEIEATKLERILEELPKDDRIILLMKYQDDFSIKEIAESLDKTESAVKMKIKRAKEKVQRIYEQLYGQDE
jgi:RNA polymerase sigma factor (sigma-70 family)